MLLLMGDSALRPKGVSKMITPLCVEASGAATLTVAHGRTIETSTWPAPLRVSVRAGFLFARRTDVSKAEV